MRKIAAILLTCLLLLSFAGCTSSSYDSQTGNKSNRSDLSGSKLTVRQKEEIAESQALKKMVEYMQLMKSEFGKYNINATEYQIGSITNSGDDYTVNGTLLLYDKYGTLKDIATFSSKVSVNDNGDYHATFPTIKIQ